MQFTIKALFDVTAMVYYYQPKPAEQARLSNSDGTSVINPNYLLIQKCGQPIDNDVKWNIRKTWFKASMDRVNEKDKDISIGDALLPMLIASAETGVPGEYDVRLPLSDQFKDDPVYSRIYLEQPNDASFASVVRGLIPFEGIRSILTDMQRNLIVPLHSVRIGMVPSDLAFRAGMPSGTLVPPRSTLQ